MSKEFKTQEWQSGQNRPGKKRGVLNKEKQWEQCENAVVQKKSWDVKVRQERKTWKSGEKWEERGDTGRRGEGVAVGSTSRNSFKVDGISDPLDMPAGRDWQGTAGSHIPKK